MKVMLRKRGLSGLVLLAAVFWLPACSSTRPYHDVYQKNLEIHTKTKSDSILLKVGASLHVYRVTGPCKVEYQGTVGLGDGLTNVGIPVGKPSYLSFEFNTSGILGGYSSSTDTSTVITPSPGHRYRINASYVDSIYSVEVAVQSPHGGKRTVLPLQKLSGC